MLKELLFMSRGKRKTPDEQLQSIDQEISMCNTKLTTLKQEREEIIKAKRENEIMQLYNLMQVSGKTVEQVTALLQESKQDENIA